MSRFTFCFALLAFAAQAAPIHLRTNDLTTPIGLDTSKPRFSWASDAKTPNWTQSAYEILIDSDAKRLDPGVASVWDSGRVASSKSVNIDYRGVSLKPEQRYAWKVLTWDSKGKETVSATSWFEAGLMSASDWKAHWIMRANLDAQTEMNTIRWLWVQNSDPMHVI